MRHYPSFLQVHPPNCVNASTSLFGFWPTQTPCDVEDRSSASGLLSLWAWTQQAVIFGAANCAQKTVGDSGGFASLLPLQSSSEVLSLHLSAERAAESTWRNKIRKRRCDAMMLSEKSTAAYQTLNAICCWKRFDKSEEERKERTMKQERDCGIKFRLWTESKMCFPCWRQQRLPNKTKELFDYAWVSALFKLANKHLDLLSAVRLFKNANSDVIKLSRIARNRLWLFQTFICRRNSMVELFLKD